jgi:hypothetical protein
MRHDLVSRIWAGVTWPGLPMLMIVAYVLDWSNVVRDTISVMFCVMMIGPWIASGGWRRSGIGPIALTHAITRHARALVRRA